MVDNVFIPKCELVAILDPSNACVECKPQTPCFIYEVWAFSFKALPTDRAKIVRVMRIATNADESEDMTEEHPLLILFSDVVFACGEDVKRLDGVKSLNECQPPERVSNIQSLVKFLKSDDYDTVLCVNPTFIQLAYENSLPKLDTYLTERGLEVLAETSTYVNCIRTSIYNSLSHFGHFHSSMQEFHLAFSNPSIASRYSHKLARATLAILGEFQRNPTSVCISLVGKAVANLRSAMQFDGVPHANSMCMLLAYQTYAYIVFNRLHAHAHAH